MEPNNAEKAIKDAVYLKQQVKLYQGNPLIEALPPVLSQDEAFDQLCYYPDYDESERDLPVHIRFHSISNLTQFFQPVYQHLDLEKRFSRLLRLGYVGRNPNTPEFNWQLNTAHELMNEQKSEFKLQTTASSFTLMGFSGIGKTTAIERILSLYPQLILHKSPLNMIQIVWLKLNCPHDGSLKSLCMDFFIKIDRLLDTNYFERFGSRRNSISSMVTRMGQIARVHCIGALVIDEIQHLMTAKSVNSQKMMNFFVTLVNEIGVPVMMIGTMKAKQILQSDFRQARRGSGQGDMVWEQMRKDEDWDFLIESMWEYQWIQNKVELTSELNETLYEESQGIIDIAVKLFALSQGRAMNAGVETITPKVIRKVARDDLKLIQPMLNALRKGSEKELAMYEDIMPMDISEYLQPMTSEIDLRASIQKKKEIHAEKRQKQESSRLKKVMDALIYLEVPVNIAEKVAEKAIQKDKDATIASAVQTALSFIEDEQTRPKKPKVTNKEVQVLPMLFKKSLENKLSVYDVLKEEGYIKNPFEELSL